MACAGAPESLAEVLELETDSPVDFAMVVRMVWVMQVKQLKHPEIIEMPVVVVDHRVVGSKALRVRVRSAQWAYWHRGQDLWLETGRMLQRLA